MSKLNQIDFDTFVSHIKKLNGDKFDEPVFRAHTKMAKSAMEDLIKLNKPKSLQDAPLAIDTGMFSLRVRYIGESVIYDDAGKEVLFKIKDNMAVGVVPKKSVVLTALADASVLNLNTGEPMDMGTFLASDLASAKLDLSTSKIAA